MWELDYKESWALKNWCFWTVVLEKTLESPKTARRSNHWILNEINNEYSLEGLMLRLKLRTLATWCKELTHWKRLWCWEILKVEGEGNDSGRDGWMASLTQWTWVWASSGEGQGSLACYSPWSQGVRHDWMTEQQEIKGRVTNFFLNQDLEIFCQRK